MKPRKPYQSPALPGEEETQPLAVLRLHWKKIFFCAAAAVLLVWGLAVVGDGLISHGKHWVTETAGFVPMPVQIEAQMTFIREEIPLPGTAQGVVVTLAEPGTRVGAGQPYALACKNTGEAEAISRSRVLEQRLHWLQDAQEAKNFQALNAEQLGRQVDDCFTDFLRGLDSGSCAGLPALQAQFLHRATTLEAALGRPVDFSGEIAETQQQLAQLNARSAAEPARLDAPVSGVYYPTADGLERVLTPQALAAVNSPEELQALLAKPAVKPAANAKLVTGFRWFMAAVLPGGDALQMEEGAKYRVVFPQESAREFNMKVEKIRRGEGEEALVVFSCEEKDDIVQCLRGAKAEIILETADGLSIPSAALRFLDKGEGQAKRPYTAVYIVRAGKLQLREVDVLYRDEKTAVVAWGTPNEARAVEGERITVQGKVQSVTKPEENRLVIIGQDLILSAETSVKPIEPDGPISVVTTRRTLFSETIVTGENLGFEQSGDTLVLTGEGIAYREQRGTGLKIHDTVLVRGRTE